MIDEQGIKLKFVRQQRTMRWDEIKHVGIKVFHYTNKSVKCIFFSTDDIPMPDKVKWYGASVDNKIFIPTRKKIMETVELYWHEPIEGIEKLSKARSNKANPTKRPASTGESGMKFNTYKLSWLVLFTLFLSFPFCLLAIYVFISGPPMLGLFFVSLPLAFSALCYLFYLVNRIIIDEQGVQYVKSGTMHRVSWDEIKHVGIGYVSNKILKKKPWIYFSSENVSMPSLRLTKDKYIKIAYRKNAVEIIRNYWHNPINGLNDLSEFEKTMKKL
jgi:hypothetical protein